MTVRRPEYAYSADLAPATHPHGDAPGQTVGMEQTTPDAWKPVRPRSTAEAALVPLLCLVGTIAVLAVAAYVSLIAVWSAATSG